MNNYNKFVPNVHFEQIPIKNLVSNQEYQRNLSLHHIDMAAKNFDLYQINPVKVSRRDGINYVFNGQHTIEIVARVSGSRETPVWCMIYDDLCYEEEADIFANQMKYVKPLTPYEIFLANIEAGNDQQLIIKELVESYGLVLSNKKAPNNIAAITTIENIYEKYGYQVLSNVLRVVIATWEGECYSLSSNVLNAIAKIIITYGDSFDEEIFKARLGEIPIKQVLRVGKERGGGALGVAEAMVLAYNGKKKSDINKLPIQKMYAKNELEAALIEVQSRTKEVAPK
ncbi:MAG: DUF6551 family protein [Eubacteriales bacterium]|nr:DUF6551 family protein [Eubacteriales bacterium]